MLIIISILKYFFSSFYFLLMGGYNLLIYRDNSIVGKFILSMINKIKETPIKALFFALDTSENNDMIKTCSTFVDGVIKL